MFDWRGLPCGIFCGGWFIVGVLGCPCGWCCGGPINKLRISVKMVYRVFGGLIECYLPEFWLKNAGLTCGAGICCTLPILFGPGPICCWGGGPRGGPCIFIFDWFGIPRNVRPIY